MSQPNYVVNGVCHCPDCVPDADYDYSQDRLDRQALLDWYAVEDDTVLERLEAMPWDLD